MYILQELSTNKDFSSLIYVLAGFAVGLGIAMIIMCVLRKGRPGKAKYDERQLALRGIAFRNGFYTMLCYSLTAYILRFASPFDIPDVFLWAGLICLGVTVTVVTMVVRDCYLALNDRPRYFIIVFSVISVVLLTSSILMATNMEDDFDLAAVTISVAVSVSFVILTISIIVKQIFIARESRREDDLS